MKTSVRIFSLALALAAIFSCSTIDALQERVDNIESRVTALETVSSAINGNIQALQAIASGQAINKVEEKDGNYVLTLSNGTTMTLTQGSVGMGKAPLMSIDKDGYWMVDYQDGNGATYITDDKTGEKIVAVGQDGVTPLFSVSADGYWTVSYNGGSSCSAVLDVNGNRVKAVASSSGEDSYFADVEYSDEKLVLTLKNGEQYTVPVVGGFLCKVNGADTDVTFRLGEKKTFSVEMKGIASTVITAPKNWEAYLTGASLSIIAPSEATTKAALADTRTDVNIVAFSEGGHIAIAKVRVQLDGSASVYDPAASIALTEAKTASLKFTVTTENATSWYYLLRAASETAPSATEVIADGTKGTDAEVLVEDLKANTEYVLYVLPCGDVNNGPLASYKASTSDFTNLYEAWEAGEEITVGSETFSKAKNGPGLLITSADGQKVESTWVNAGTYGAFFVQDGAFANLRADAFTKSVIVIGVTPGSRPTVKLTAQIVLDGADCNLVLKNLSVDMSALTNQFIPNGKAYGKIIVDDCYIDLQWPLTEKFNTAMTGFEMVNSDILVDWASGNTNKPFIVSAHVGGTTCGDFTFSNNVVWSNSGKKEFHLCGTPYSGTNTYEAISVTNNTFYNINNGLNSNGREKAMFRVKKVTSLKVEGNIVYDTAPDSKTVSTRPHFNWIYTDSMKIADLKTATTMNTQNLIDIAESCSLYGNDGKEWTLGFKNLIHWQSGTASANTVIDSWDNPFKSEDAVNGAFEVTAEYEDYGAKR